MGAELSVFFLSPFYAPESWLRLFTFKNILARLRDLGLEPAYPRDTCVGLESNFSNTFVVLVFVVVVVRPGRRRRHPSSSSSASPDYYLKRELAPLGYCSRLKRHIKKVL